MEAVDNDIIQSISEGRESKIFTEQNIQTLRENPNQWFLIASVVNKDNYLNIVRSYNSSAIYFKNKLRNKYGMTIETRCRQNRNDKSAKLFVRLIEEA